jgi:hypothetical protein
MPLPRSLAYLKREISETKWAEARRWAGDRVSQEKYKLPANQRPDRTVAGSTKRLASRFYQLKTDRAVPTAQCWWCRYRTQTREHFFKVCPEWKAQQKILWAEMRKETGRGESRFTIRDLLADERCSQSVLDFLSTTDVGRLVPVEDEAQSEVSEWELQERGEREEERRVEAEELGATTTVSPNAFLHGVCGRGVGAVDRFPLYFLGTTLLSWGQAWPWPGRRANGSLQRAAIARTADMNWAKCTPP